MYLTYYVCNIRCNLGVYWEFHIIWNHQTTLSIYQNHPNTIFPLHLLCWSDTSKMDRANCWGLFWFCQSTFPVSSRQNDPQTAVSTDSFGCGTFRWNMDYLNIWIYMKIFYWYCPSTGLSEAFSRKRKPHRPNKGKLKHNSCMYPQSKSLSTG